MAIKIACPIDPANFENNNHHLSVVKYNANDDGKLTQ